VSWLDDIPVNPNLQAPRRWEYPAVPLDEADAIRKQVEQFWSDRPGEPIAIDLDFDAPRRRFVASNAGWYQFTGTLIRRDGTWQWSTEVVYLGDEDLPEPPVSPSSPAGRTSP